MLLYLASRLLSDQAGPTQESKILGSAITLLGHFRSSFPLIVQTENYPVMPQFMALDHLPFEQSSERAPHVGLVVDHEDVGHGE